MQEQAGGIMEPPRNASEDEGKEESMESILAIGTMCTDIEILNKSRKRNH